MRSTTRGVVWLSLLCGMAVALAPPYAAAQDAAQSTAGPLQLGGSFRLRLESWNWFTPSLPASDHYVFGAGLLRGSVGMVRPAYEWQVELAAPVLVGLPEGAVAPLPQGQLGFGAAYRTANGERKVGLVAKQVFVQAKLGRAERAPSLRAGRFDFNEGQETQPQDATLAWLKRERIAQRLVGSFGFTHVGRSFDGLHFKWGSSATDLTFVAVRPTEGVFQLDALGELDIEMAYAALTRSFLPVAGPDGPQPSAEGRLFALYYQDGRTVLKTDSRAAPERTADGSDIRVATFGGHYLQTFGLGPGKADLLLWGAVQVGDWGAQRHRAHAYTAELGYRPELPGQPWIRLGYFLGSGDAAPGDAEHRTFFQVLPTPRPFARFPFFNLMNSEDAFVELHASPVPTVTVRASAHSLRLEEAADLWYAGGGAFDGSSFGFIGRPSGGGKDLARLVDLSVDYRMSPRVGVTLYAGRAMGRDVLRSVYPDGANGTYAYLEIQRRF